jgi:hypothetical protein
MRACHHKSVFLVRARRACHGLFSPGRFAKVADRCELYIQSLRRFLEGVTSLNEIITTGQGTGDSIYTPSVEKSGGVGVAAASLSWART